MLFALVCSVWIMLVQPFQGHPALEFVGRNYHGSVSWQMHWFLNHVIVIIRQPSNGGTGTFNDFDAAFFLFCAVLWQKYTAMQLSLYVDFMSPVFVFCLDRERQRSPRSSLVWEGGRGAETPQCRSALTARWASLTCCHGYKSTHYSCLSFIRYQCKHGWPEGPNSTRRRQGNALTEEQRNSCPHLRWMLIEGASTMKYSLE